MSGGDRYSAASRGQLNSFLGLPSDEGLHNLSSSGAGRIDNFDVNRGAVEGPRGGYAAGATVTGPRGNTVGRAAAVGPEGGVAAARGFRRCWRRRWHPRRRGRSRRAGRSRRCGSRT